ncbi:hypothetical protein EVAR_30913_1 [Eumeta japonica]|uniref:Uncharacterized protein n=1 Tax=Eumeta variegata TaxID=151549 RepID=A0A4C1V5N7_EUMVA|nr:hypothetical protein EVAR_30913_1 [Eumeta japonica]
MRVRTYTPLGRAPGVDGPGGLGQRRRSDVRQKQLSLRNGGRKPSLHPSILCCGLLFMILLDYVKVAGAGAHAVLAYRRARAVACRGRCAPAGGAGARPGGGV